VIQEESGLTAASGEEESIEEEERVCLALA
jgi:hypothetical protein